MNDDTNAHLAECSRCEHELSRHVGCGEGYHEGSPHSECCDEDDCTCPGFEP